MATVLTELEAVNAALRLLGRRPVNSLLPADLPPDAAFILEELRYQNRLVQEQGWHFNTENSAKLLKNASERVPIADDIARVDTAKRYGRTNFGIDPIVRVHPTDGRCLYDKTALTRDEDPFDFSHTSEVRVDLVRLLDFEETPSSFRHYITVRAGRAVQARIIADPTLYRLTLDDEARALQVLMKEELDTSDASALNARGIRQWTRRRSPLGWLESI